MVESFSKQEMFKRVRWYINLRWFLVLVFGLTGLLPQLIQEGFVYQVQQNFLILLTVIGLNALFFGVSAFRFARHTIYEALAIGQLGLDLAIVTGIVYSNGGIENIVVMMYIIPIIMSGALLGRLAVYLTGLIASFTYDLLLILDYKQVVTPHNILAPTLHSNRNYLIETMFFAPAILLTITFITDFVGKIIRDRTRLLTELQVVSTQRAEIEAIIKSMGSALVAVDTNGNIMLVNNSFEDLTGWKRDEVLGASFDSVLPLLNENGQRVPAVERPILRLLSESMAQPSTEIKHISKYYYARKNGTTFPFVASLASITIDGKVTGATTVFEDASSLKQIQQLKNNFVALASHQLKTPISEIKGYLDNMTNGVTGKLNKRQSEYLEQMRDITERCNKLITDLLDLTVIEQGNLNLDIQPVKLGEVIKKGLGIYKQRLKQNNLKLKQIEADEVLMIMADKDKLVEAFGNILANAVNYTKKETTITVESKRDGDFALIFVTDEGPGMEPELAKSLFQKDDVLSKAPEAEGGTGIGLYLTKQLMSLQGGDVSVVSSTKNGTSLCLKIPLESHDER